MKKRLLLTVIFAFIFLGIDAKNEVSIPKNLYPFKQYSTGTILLKYSSRNQKTQDFSYSLRVPMNETTLSFLSNKTKPRFLNNKFTTSRSLNLSNSDLKFIVEKNKLYQFTKENFRVKEF